MECSWDFFTAVDPKQYCFTEIPVFVLLNVFELSFPWRILLWNFGYIQEICLQHQGYFECYIMPCMLIIWRELFTCWICNLRFNQWCFCNFCTSTVEEIFCLNYTHVLYNVGVSVWPQDSFENLRQLSQNSNHPFINPNWDICVFYFTPWKSRQGRKIDKLFHFTKSFYLKS